MEKTAPVKQAVERDEIVVACAYRGWVPEEVKAALPEGFSARSYVARFENGKLIAVERGLPEQAIQKLLGVGGSNPGKEKTCEDSFPEAKP